MMADLEKKEAVVTRERNEEEEARAQWAAAMARMEQKLAEREAASRRAQAAKRSVNDVAATNGGDTPTDEEQKARLDRTLVATWVKKVRTGGRGLVYCADSSMTHNASHGMLSEQGKDYSVGDLRAIFEEHGPVEDVYMRKEKKKTASALIVMTDAAGVQSATSAVNGALESPLLVVPLAKARSEEPPAASVPGAGKEHASSVPKNSLFPSASAGTLGSIPSKPLFSAARSTTIPSTSAFPSRFPAGAGGTMPAATPNPFGSFSSFGSTPKKPKTDP